MCSHFFTCILVCVFVIESLYKIRKSSELSDIEKNCDTKLLPTTTGTTCGLLRQFIRLFFCFFLSVILVICVKMAKRTITW